MTDYKHIEELLERFFDGRTSNEEEQKLYSFFSGNDIPERLKSYIPLFQFFETEMKREFNNIQNKIPGTKKLTGIKKQLSLWIGIAASFLLLVTVFNKIIKNDNAFDPYEGSYIIHNGKIITDPDVIHPELEATVKAVSKQRELIEKMVNDLPEEDDYNQVTQEIEVQYCLLVNSFPDKITREKVKEILNVECN
ncbi:MAG: hypothetical protein LBJ72_06460 [Dysgonamonadaceae bacterium]|jgi:hypothetical protein|nr:hypothetical protein [Dysgonamonadaceae bacterium]